MLMILAAILLPTVLGFLVTAILFREVDGTSADLLDRLALSYPLGMGLLTFQMFALALLRIPLTLAALVPLLVLESIALVFWLRAAGIPYAPRPSFGLWQEIASPAASLLRKAVLALLTVWIVIKAGSILYEASLRPIFGWDAWANWSASAKAFFYARGLMLDAPGEDFFGGGIVSRIQSYPLHNHLLQLWLALWAGGFDEVLVKLWSPFYLICAAAALYGFARRETGRTAALALTAVFLGSPLISYHGVEAYSDMMLGVNLLFALLSFVRAMRGNRGAWPLVGFFSAVALFTKNESPGFILPLLLSSAVFLWMNRRRSPLAPAAARILVPFVLVAPWLLFKFIHSLSLTQDAHQISPAWQPGVLPFVLRQFLSFENFGILFPMLVLLLVVNGRPSRELLHALFPVAFYAAFFVLIYSLVEYYHRTLLLGTIFFRNTMTYYPAACLVTAIVIGELLRKTSLRETAPVLPAGNPGKRRRAR
jgi:hypothetical protein